jgi:hypothetical protein
VESSRFAWVGILRGGFFLESISYPAWMTRIGWSEKLVEKTKERALSVLTDEHKAKWKKLTGDPVPNLSQNAGGFGPFGGGVFLAAGSIERW